MTQQRPIGDLPETKVTHIRRALWTSQQLMIELVEHPALAMHYGHTLAWRNMVSAQGGAYWHLSEDKRLSPTARTQHALANELSPITARGLPKPELIEHVKFERLKAIFKQRLLASAVELLVAHPNPELPGVHKDTEVYKEALLVARRPPKRRAAASEQQARLL